MRTYRTAGFGFVVLVLLSGFSPRQAAADACGQMVQLSGHDGTRLGYSLAGPASGAKAAAVLLPGGGGFIDLDGAGCPRKLKGNSLIRSRPMFHEGGLVTALLDAPDDHHGQDGLGGFRVETAHAEDIGRVIADLRARTGLPVWLIGTSRGAISAVNAASRLTGPAAPDGIVVTSPVTSGNEGAAKPWVAHSVFTLALEKITAPVLVVVHEDDRCMRSPPQLGPRILDAANGSREQAVTVTGGPGGDGDPCQGKSAHGFLGQEAETAAGIARFILGSAY